MSSSKKMRRGFIKISKQWRITYSTGKRQQLSRSLRHTGGQHSRLPVQESKTLLLIAVSFFLEGVDQFYRHFIAGREFVH